MSTSIKGPAPAPTSFPNASSLRIGIVHARWNQVCIDALVKGTVESLIKAGVQKENVVIESVPGSWELPIGVSRLIAASQSQASSNADDLISATSLLDAEPEVEATATQSLSKPSRRALDAVIGIGVLIKGSTMHFEYISSSACDGLMRVSLDSGIPVILGILTALTEDQALERSGIETIKEGKRIPGHNHGLDWGFAAVEMATKTQSWAEGKLGA